MRDRPIIPGLGLAAAMSAMLLGSAFGPADPPSFRGRHQVAPKKAKKPRKFKGSKAAKKASRR